MWEIWVKKLPKVQKIAQSGHTARQTHLHSHPTSAFFVIKLGGNPALAVMEGDSCSRGRGFESHHQRLHKHFFTLICGKFEKDCKNKQNEAGDSSFKKNSQIRT